MKKQISIISALLILSLSAMSQAYTSVGAGLAGTVNGLHTDTIANRLYATGAFSGKVAYWNGTIWNSTVPTFTGTADGNAIMSYTNATTSTNDLLVCSDRVYLFNGVTWSTIGPVGTWSTICVYGSYIFVGGKDISGFSSLLRFDPASSYTYTSFYFPSPSPSADITDLEVYGGSLYATGIFASSGYIAKLTSPSSTVTVLGTILTATACSSIDCAKTYNGNLYFSGAFQGFNSVVSTNFIKHNGASFITTGGTLPATKMERYSGNLYIATRSSSPCMKVWNGSTTTNIVSSNTLNLSGSLLVNSMAVYNGELYAGGNFTLPFANIARYNANPLLVVTASTITNVSCNGGSNGSANCVVSGGLPSYTYSWSPGSYTTASVSGLTAGTYTVKVTDAASMVKTSTVLITQPTAVVATQSQTNISCNGGSNGSATVVASGGTPGYTYSWSPTGGSLSSASGFSVGSYTCLIKDLNNCSINKTFNIIQPTALASTISSTNESAPSMNDGSANVNPTGGTPGYTYSWTPSSQTSQTAIGLTGGNYTCTITDSKGCTTVKTVSVLTTPASTVVTGIETHTIPVGVFVYPNPSNGKINIEANNSNVNIINSIGQIILSIFVDTNETLTIETPGIYFVQVTQNGNGKIFNSRLIVQ